MRINVTRNECQTIIDCLKGQMLKCDRKVRENLAKVLDWQLTGKGPDDPKRRWVPIRNNWPSGQIKAERRTDWSFHKPRPKKQQSNNGSKPKAEPKKQQPTAEDILASI